MKKLFLFVEGPDDERFLEQIYKDCDVKFIQYSCEQNKIINSQIKTIKSNNFLDYLFFTDADGCSIQDRIDRTVEKYHDCEDEKVCVVQFEIESWYLAGITQESARKMKIKYCRCTDSVTKENFNAIKPQKLSRIDFMIEILKQYDKQEAQLKNTSFRCFFQNNFPQQEQ